MKNLSFATKWLLSAALIFSAASCSTEVTPTADTAGPRFHDDSQINAVLQFASWDWTFLVRPEYSENGYLGRVRPDNINQVLDQMNVLRGTAAVVVGWTYTGDTLDKLVADWKTILSRCGFQRVIVLRAQEGNSLDGSLIIDDSVLHVSSAQSASQGG
jgi:hypothetical protein